MAAAVFTMLLVACAQATPTPLPSVNVFNLTLRAEPVAGQPLTVRFIIGIAGGPDNAPEMYCNVGEWEFGDGNHWSIFPNCIPWNPDWKMARHFELTYTYPQPGTYEVVRSHGPLKTSLVVEVP